MFDSIPSLDDLHGDGHVRTSSVPDELMFPGQPADAFPPEEPMSDAELERLCAEAEDGKPRRATAVQRTSVGVIGFLTVEDESGRRIVMSDLASVFAYNHVGQSGTVWRDCIGTWIFDADPEVVAEPQPILTRPIMLNPAAWGMTGGDAA